MIPFVQDSDFTLYVGDVREVLATLPDGSVDCVVTSPPYWGLRDYGTGLWEGGEQPCEACRGTGEGGPDGERCVSCGGAGMVPPNCDHTVTTIPRALDDPGIRRSTLEGGKKTTTAQAEGSQYRDVCGKCGATRKDQQLGLERTPDLYVDAMVGVFREVRRVLALHGTAWINLGDSYHGGGYANHAVNGEKWLAEHGGDRRRTRQQDRINANPDLKPKDLVGIPWRVAFALQADGWYLRSDIVWAKPNPMPESVTDRPTKAHEYVFLLTRSPRYFFDQEAVREPAEWQRWGDQTNRKHEGSGSAAGWIGDKPKGDLSQRRTAHYNTADRYGAGNGGNSGFDGLAKKMRDGEHAGRNIRSVWEIATQPYAEAHFATYPEELVRRCLLAGCPEWVCGTCGVPRTRVVDVSYDNPGNRTTNGPRSLEQRHEAPGFGQRLERRAETVGWSDCGHNNYRPGVVLDPFMGSGTTALVARRHGRRSIGIELNEQYAALCAKRLQQLSLLAEGDAA